MDLAPAQVNHNMRSCLIGAVLIFRAISASSHNITIEEFLTLFQPKDSGGKNKGIFNRPTRSGAHKLIHGLPDSTPHWKKRFFYVSGVGWEHDPKCSSIHDLKRWVLEPDSIIKKKPELVKSSWIESSKDFFIKHFGDVVAPMMLWRYGLGPRPVNTDPRIIFVDDLPDLAVLLPSKRNDLGLITSGVGDKGAPGPALKMIEAAIIVGIIDKIRTRQRCREED